MAVVKTYSISTDVTAGSITAGVLHNEIADSGSVTNFSGLVESGDSLEILGDSLANESLLDTTVQTHDPNQSVPEVPDIKLDVVTNGEMLALSVEAGTSVWNSTWNKLYTFDGDVWMSAGLIKCINGNSSASMTEGNPVIEDSAGSAGEVTFTSTSNSIAIVGVVKDVYGGGGPGQYVTVAISGEHNVLMNGSVARGTLVVSSSTGGQATDSTTGTPGGFGITRDARTGGGASLVKCFITSTERY